MKSRGLPRLKLGNLADGTYVLLECRLSFCGRLGLKATFASL